MNYQQQKPLGTATNLSTYPCAAISSLDRQQATASRAYLGMHLTQRATTHSITFGDLAMTDVKGEQRTTIML